MCQLSRMDIQLPWHCLLQKCHCHPNHNTCQHITLKTVGKVVFLENVLRCPPPTPWLKSALQWVRAVRLLRGPETSCQVSVKHPVCAHGEPGLQTRSVWGHRARQDPGPSSSLLLVQLQLPLLPPTPHSLRKARYPSIHHPKVKAEGQGWGRRGCRAHTVGREPGLRSARASLGHQGALWELP